MSEPREELTVVIVDDEPPARDLLRQYLERADGFRVTGQCADGFEAVKKVEELAPDVLLLDVQMPKLNGFEVLDLLDSPPQVIFTTAHDRYALKAFEVEAVDYLLKPFSAERLFEALERARQRRSRGDTQSLASLARRHREESAPLERLLVRDGARVHVIPAVEIDWIEARDDYVEVHRGQRTYRKKQTLTELESLLGDRFLRIHRGYLLNVDRLRRIEPYAKDSRVVFLRDGTRLPLSRSGYALLRERL
ncbi:MAG: LytTR family DNA-binding domain-containing protein [Thermoanaerobaculia bacterium]|nr:LytTR family DNA-binding domain-containing protein [Thermoanaerobaculia bacterium]